VRALAAGRQQCARAVFTALLAQIGKLGHTNDAKSAAPGCL
jgi:hypothetical protein